MGLWKRVLAVELRFKARVLKRLTAFLLLLLIAVLPLFAGLADIFGKPTSEQGATQSRASEMPEKSAPQPQGAPGGSMTQQGSRDEVPAERPFFCSAYVASPPDSVNRAAPAQSDGDAISAITGFYQTIFAALAMVMGLVVALAYLTIRAVSRESVQETVQKEASQYFTRDKPFLDKLEGDIEGIVQEQLLGMDLPVQIEKLSTRLASLESLSSPAEQDSDVETKNAEIGEWKDPSVG